MNDVRVLTGEMRVTRCVLCGNPLDGGTVRVDDSGPQHQACVDQVLRVADAVEKATWGRLR